MSQNPGQHSFSESHSVSSYCLSSEHTHTQSSTSSTPDLSPASRSGSTTQPITNLNALQLDLPDFHMQEPFMDKKASIISNDNDENSWYKAGAIRASINKAITESVSSASSVYSSSEKAAKRAYAVPKIEASGRSSSSIISHSQESERSASSSVGFTSVSNNSSLSQEHVQQHRGQNNRLGLSNAFLYNPDPYKSSRIKEKERNPLK